MQEQNKSALKTTYSNSVSEQAQQLYSLQIYRKYIYKQENHEHGLPAPRFYKCPRVEIVNNFDNELYQIVAYGSSYDQTNSLVLFFRELVTVEDDQRYNGT